MSSIDPESDIPWFSNFGKFVETPEFFAYQGQTNASQLPQNPSSEQFNHSGISQQWMQSNREYDFSSLASANNMPALATNGLMQNDMPQVPTFRRATSEVIHPTRQSHSAAAKGREPRAPKTARSSEADDGAPKTLGAMLRRMVSFDQYSRRNLIREQDTFIPVYEGVRVFSELPFTKGCEEAPQCPSGSSRIFPPTVPLGTDESLLAQRRAKKSSMKACIDRSVHSQVRKIGFSGRNRESDGEAPKTLSAVLRRMVSFDQPSRRTMSRAHESPVHRRGRRVDQIEQLGTFNGYNDADGPEKSIRRW